MNVARAVTPPPSTPSYKGTDDQLSELSRCISWTGGVSDGTVHISTPAEGSIRKRVGEGVGPVGKRLRTCVGDDDTRRVRFGAVEVRKYDSDYDVTEERHNLWYSMDEIQRNASSEVRQAQASLPKEEYILYLKSIFQLLVHSKRWDPLTALVCTGSSAPPVEAQVAAYEIARSPLRGLERTLATFFRKQRNTVNKAVLSEQASLKKQHDDPKLKAYLLSQRYESLSRASSFFAQLMASADAREELESR